MRNEEGTGGPWGRFELGFLIYLDYFCVFFFFCLLKSWKQLFLILSDINLLGLSGDAQEVFDAITVLDRQISNL